MDSWIDVPQDILALIHNKSCFPDQIRFRAVCKSWRIPDGMIRSNHLPCVFHHTLMNHSTVVDLDKFPSEIMNPHTKQVQHSFSNSVYSKFGDGMILVLATFQGWVLLKKSTPFVVHNVFTGQLINLPRLDTAFYVYTATFLNDHTEIFAVCRLNSGKCYAATLCLSRDTNWSIQALEDKIFPKDVVYIKGDRKVYLLYSNAKLVSYSLVTKSCELVTSSSFGELLIDPKMLHLFDKDGDLMMTNLTLADEFVILKFDWSQKHWIVERNLKNIALFLNWTTSQSVIVTTENTGDCRLYFNHNCRLYFNHVDDKMLVSYYSFLENKIIISQDYRWISSRPRKSCNTSAWFIQPPSIS